jgi:hypothetical protein
MLATPGVAGLPTLPIPINFTAPPPPPFALAGTSRTFANCPVRAPADCGGHGKLGGQCFCSCDDGYATDYSVSNRGLLLVVTTCSYCRRTLPLPAAARSTQNLLAPRWCIPVTRLTTAGNRTVDVFATPPATRTSPWKRKRYTAQISQRCASIQPYLYCHLHASGLADR